jgi:cytochrome c peroxidase
MQRFPLFAPRFGQMERDATEAANLGRFTLTGRPEDRCVFRVPSLRNVALTAPYFHDGRAASLNEAVAEMAASQLGRRLPQSDIASITKFLATLSGVSDADLSRTRRDKRY